MVVPLNLKVSRAATLSLMMVMGAQSRAATFQHWEGPVEIVQGSAQDAPPEEQFGFAHPRGDPSVDLGHTGEVISAGLGALSQRSGWRWLGEQCLVTIHGASTKEKCVHQSLKYPCWSSQSLFFYLSLKSFTLVYHFFCHRLFVLSASPHQRGCYTQHGESSSNKGDV